jgi:hypothetical protein
MGIDPAIQYQGNLLVATYDYCFKCHRAISMGNQFSGLPRLHAANAELTRCGTGMLSASDIDATNGGAASPELRPVAKK